MAVPGVPDQSDPTAGAQHPGQLGERGFGVEPVERLRDGDRVDRAGREGQRLRGAGHRRDIGLGAVQDLAHPLDRLDGDDPRPARREEPGQLAGPGGQVDEPGAGPDDQPVLEPLHRVGRIRRAALLVGVGAAAEPRRGDLVDRHG